MMRPTAPLAVQEARHFGALMPATAPEYSAASETGSALVSALTALLLLGAVVGLSGILVIVEQEALANALVPYLAAPAAFLLTDHMSAEFMRPAVIAEVARAR